MLRNLQFLRPGFSDWFLFVLLLVDLTLVRLAAPYQFVLILLLLIVPTKAYQWYNITRIFEKYNAQSTIELEQFSLKHARTAWLFGVATFLSCCSFATYDDAPSNVFGTIIFCASLFLGRTVYRNVMHLDIVETILLVRHAK